MNEVVADAAEVIGRIAELSGLRVIIMPKEKEVPAATLDTIVARLDELIQQVAGLQQQVALLALRQPWPSVPYTPWYPGITYTDPISYDESTNVCWSCGVPVDTACAGPDTSCEVCGRL